MTTYALNAYIAEERRRIYYQNIVHSVCRDLDEIEGRSISRGTGIVCGTAETPSTEVEEAMERLLWRRGVEGEAMNGIEGLAKMLELSRKEVGQLRQKNERLLAKLQRTRDFFKFAANLESGIVAEIDAELTAAKEERDA